MSPTQRSPVLASIADNGSSIPRVTYTVSPTERSWPPRSWAQFLGYVAFDYTGVRSKGFRAEMEAGPVEVAFTNSTGAPLHPQPVVRATRLDFPLEGMTCVLCDDVRYSGWTLATLGAQLRQKGAGPVEIAKAAVRRSASVWNRISISSGKLGLVT